MRNVWLSFGLLLTTFVLFFVGTSRNEPQRIDGPLAIGLRGTNRVTRPLSKIQQKRLEEHFLVTPVVPTPANGASSGAGNEVRQINAINAFNRRQNP